MRLANRIKRLHRAQTSAGSLWLALALCLTPLPAAAVNVTVGGLIYDISYTNTSYNASTVLLEGQPWWGDPTLADNIITQYISDGGNTFGDLTVFSLYFAVNPSAVDPTGSVATRSAFVNTGPSTGDALNLGTLDYALALSVTPVGPAAVPEIDGNAMVKALFVLFALWLWLTARRGRGIAEPGAVG